MDKDQDKENVKAKNQLRKKLCERPPLNTLAGPNGLHRVSSKYDLNTLCMAGPSSSEKKSVINRPKTPFRTHTKFGGCGDSDSNFIAFQEDESVTTVSSDEETDTKQEELQGITPLENRVIRNDRAKRIFNPNQTVGERMQPPDILQKSYMAKMDREYNREILSYLRKAESKFVDLPPVKSETRACVINWLMKINGDGNPATIQTAIWYLDAVRGAGFVTPDNMQLMTAASYFIAAKLHGPRMRASVLVKDACHAFTKEQLLEMERTILVTLKFPRQPVVPHNYICYFAWWCNKERPGEIEVASTFLCLCGMMVDKRLCPEYPSVVAAASIRNALLLLGKTELTPRLQKCPGYVAAEQKGNVSKTGTILRKAVRVVAAKECSYNFIFEQYGNIARTIASAAID